MIEQQVFPQPGPEQSTLGSNASEAAFVPEKLPVRRGYRSEAVGQIEDRGASVPGLCRAKAPDRWFRAVSRSQSLNGFLRNLRGSTQHVPTLSCFI